MGRVKDTGDEIVVTKYSNEIPMYGSVAIQVGVLGNRHDDPADRMIVATTSLEHSPHPCGY